MILDTHPFLIAAITQTFLYGVYLVSLGHALRWLLLEEEGWSLRSRDKVNWLLLTTTAVIFVFSTVDVIFDMALQLTFTGGLEYGGRDITQQLVIASVAIETATLLITDAVLIFRCWLVYQKSWRAVCFPFTLWVINVTCMVLWVVGYALSEFNSPIYRLLSRPSMQLFYSCSFTTNLYATSAIVYRVWRVARVTNKRSSILYRVCRIVAGTGILYTSTSLPLVVSTFLIVTQKPIYILCNAINFSVCGITFNLLLIRVGQLRAEVEMGIHESTHDISASVPLSTLPQSDNPDMDCFDESRSVPGRNHTDAKLKQRIGKGIFSPL